MVGDREMRISRSGKIMIICALVVVFAFMFLPVYQRGVNHTWNEMISASEKKLESMEMQMRELESSIAAARTPEALIQGVNETGIEYAEISTSSAIRVARGE